MIGNKEVLGIILARGGSKRLPGKNVRSLGGKPMIAWTIEAGLKSRTIDRLILSSDDDAIMEVGQKYGCEVPFRRPADLASDTASSADGVMHALDQLDIHAGYFVLLQPTSPLRLADDIDACVETCHNAGAPICATVSEVDVPVEWHLTLDEFGRIQKPFKAAAPMLFVPNGMVYVADIEWFRMNRSFWVEGVTVAHQTPASRSIDVDTLEDFFLAEAIIGTR